MLPVFGSERLKPFDTYDLPRGLNWVVMRTWRFALAAEGATGLSSVF